jgi:hypothetical protein
MISLVATTRRLLAIGVVALVAGCAASTNNCARHGSNECSACRNGSRCPLRTVACGVYHGTLADEVMCCDVGCLSQSYGGNPCPKARSCGPECVNCRECCLMPLGLKDAAFSKPQPGPPPASIRPPAPPKFLEVPVQPVVSPVRPEAPDAARGNVEVGYRPKLTVPGND